MTELGTQPRSIETSPTELAFTVEASRLAYPRVVPPEHPAYRFAYLGRRLFEYDRFHLTQTQFPYAYLFHPVEVRDKTPYPRQHGQCPSGESSLDG